jgi:hypothetical protein
MTAASTSSSSAAQDTAKKALIAELVVGEIGRALGLPVPEIVLATLPEELARVESHDETRDLLGWSVGLPTSSARSS